jgi:Asp-tRNA(Asn)/Glu-tRNA(Gln) amidotransferase B subunit
MLNGMTLESFLSTSVPELPMQVTKRLVDQDGLSEDMAHLISSDRSTLSFYESTVKCIHKALQDGPLSAEDAHRIPTITANWLCNDLYALIKGTIMVSRSQTLHPSKGGKAINEDEDHDDDTSNNDLVPSVEHSRVDVARFSSLLVLLIQGSISSTQAKKILGIMFHEDYTNNAATIAQSKGWKLIKSLQELENMCRQVVFDPRNKDQLDQYRQGGKHIRKLTKFYVGEVMSLSGGNAHPEWLEVALERILIEVNEHKGVE